MIKEFPTLYAVTSTGGIKQWSILAMIDDKTGNAILRKVFGAYGGKLQTNDKIINGKNIGKSNETTPFEQACADAQSDWKKKRDKNYVEHVLSPNEAPANVLPMLAHPYKDRSHNIKWPALAQPKLNGVRCLATKVSETEMQFRSRKGKSYDDVCAHMAPYLLESMTVGNILDGELYNHDWTFQEITRHAKKVRDDQDQLQYWVYDMAMDDMAFIERVKIIKTQLPDVYQSNLFEMVQTLMVVDDRSFMRMHNTFVKEGFEGAIVRNTDGFYKFGHRSVDLQKYKEFFDEEFTISGGKAAEGSHAGCVVFLVRDENGVEFDVAPKGSLEYKRKLFNELDSLIGKKLTVRYQEKSEAGVPIFPVGLVIRDYEDS